ncbi:hypothetical protein BDW22DRAFT_1358651 [Trametopsis cervina]|nr:hypothetical protein BDW22DRAFT_1358651 [Trametopsis cervina]
MSWFANLFGSSKPARNSGRTAIVSTHEAFSLPTSSPRHPMDGFQSGSPLTNSPPQSSGSYSYPPQSPPGTYDYLPSGTSSRRQSSTLPLHNGPGMSTKAPFPPLNTTWNRLRTWLSNEYPELGDTLNYGILPPDLAQIEMAFGFALPQAVRDSYLCADGQEPESSAGCSEGLFFGLTLLPLEDVMEEWRFWREVDDDPNSGANPQLRDRMDSIPPGWVKREYSSRGWIPLVADKAGNYLGVDMSPGEGGAVGQVIVFGRDFDTKVVMYRGDGEHGWAKWLSGFVDDLESGEGFELGATAEGSEGSEDSVGYESYFFDGTGRGSGDGGGDAGSAGMRLAGEYKGWNVLEAWADRSVRKWQELGVIATPEELPQGKYQTADDISKEAIRAVTDSSGAEIPIPVLKSASTATLPLVGGTAPIPTISVTKPPAPLPVDVPTADDVISIAEPPNTDLEAGGSMSMREIGAALPTSRTSGPTSPTTPTAHTEKLPAPLPPPPASPAQTPTRALYAASDFGPSSSQTTDFLADSSSSLSTVAAPPLVATPEDSSSSPGSVDSAVLVDSDDALSPPLKSVQLASGREEALSDGVLVSDPEDSPESRKTVLS